MPEWIRKRFPLKFSLRRRIAAGLLCMTLPLVVVSATGFFSQNVIIGYLDEIARESEGEIAPVLRIHMALQHVMMPVHDYLIYGEQERELERFRERATEVDRAFGYALSGPFALASKESAPETTSSSTPCWPPLSGWHSCPPYCSRAPFCDRSES